MGGLLILAAVALATLLWADLRNPYVWLALLTMLAFGAIGFLDDYLKLSKKHGKGLSIGTKLRLQGIVAVLTAVALVWIGDLSTRLALPFFKDLAPDLGVIGFISLATLVIVRCTVWLPGSWAIPIDG